MTLKYDQTRSVSLFRTRKAREGLMWYLGWLVLGAPLVDTVFLSVLYPDQPDFPTGAFFVTWAILAVIGLFFPVTVWVYCSVADWVRRGD